MSSIAAFHKQFEAFANFGTTRFDGTCISLSQSDRWMKQAKVLGADISPVDTAIYFAKQRLPRLRLAEYFRFLEDLTSKKEGLFQDTKSKMTSCGPPAGPKMEKPGKTASSIKAAAAVVRLFDPCNYTGTQRIRAYKTGKCKRKTGRKGKGIFGRKGKGITGRKDVLGDAEKDEQHSENFYF